MARGVVLTLFVIASLGFATFTLYENIPHGPVYLSEDEMIPDELAIVEYGLTPVFAENLRFNHNNISYLIDSSCSERRKSSMLKAFDIFEEKMGLISFYEVSSDADIGVGCSDDYISVGENLFAAGEGGPSRIVNTSGFKVIEEGKIVLYDDQRCDYPIVELHELLHVFGFDHTENPTSIMYNTSKCNQRITSDMIQIIKDLYSIEPKADVLIKNLTVVKRGRYLDFNITVLNEGLAYAEDVELTILSRDKAIQNIDLEDIGIGYGRSMTAKNIRLQSSGIDEVVFYLDYSDNIPEINEENNVRRMYVS